MTRWTHEMDSLLIQGIERGDRQIDCARTLKVTRGMVSSRARALGLSFKGKRGPRKGNQTPRVLERQPKKDAAAALRSKFTPTKTMLSVWELHSKRKKSIEYISRALRLKPSIVSEYTVTMHAWARDSR